MNDGTDQVLLDGLVLTGDTTDELGVDELPHVPVQVPVQLPVHDPVGKLLEPPVVCAAASDELAALAAEMEDSRADEADCASAIGQTVVYTSTVLVTVTSVWLSGWAGQLVTVAAQLVMVMVCVSQMVCVVMVPFSCLLGKYWPWKSLAWAAAIRPAAAASLLMICMVNSSTALQLWMRLVFQRVRDRSGRRRESTQRQIVNKQHTK